MKKNILLAIILIIITITNISCKKNRKTSPEELTDLKKIAKTLVDKAIVFHKKNGKEKVLEELNKKNGLFVKGTTYAFAYDKKGVLIANPLHKKLLGGDLSGWIDSRGKFFRKEILRKTKNSDSGWIVYIYPHPVTKKETEKMAYCKGLDDMIICAGFYYKK